MYKLTNQKRTIFVPAWEWSRILQIIFHFGWQPAGTSDPTYLKNITDQAVHGFNQNNNEWKCGYFESGLQMVGEQDAISMSKAMESVLAKLKAGSIGFYRSKNYSDWICVRIRGLKQIEEQNIWNMCIGFFQEGSFRIWHE